MTKQRPIVGAALGLLLIGLLLSACGTVPVAETWPGLTVADGTVYVIGGTPQQVYLLDAENGTQKGTFIPAGEHRGVVYWSPVTVGGGRAFVGFSEPQAGVYGLYAFDPTTRLEQWHVSVQDLILAAPVYADGVVYFGTSDGQVYAVDAETGAEKPGWPFRAREAIWASPLVAGGRVYVPSMDHSLYCLEAATGQVVWEFKANGSFAAQPILADGILYVGAFDGRLYAIHADSGQAVEGFAFQADNWIWSEALLADGRLYVTALDGRLYALDPATGAVLPPYPYDSKEATGQRDLLRAAPVQAGDRILVVTRSGRVIAVRDGVGQVWWPSGLPQAEILTTPVVAAGRVYLALMNGQVQTLDAETGVPGWFFSPPAGK